MLLALDDATVAPDSLLREFLDLADAVFAGCFAFEMVAKMVRLLTSQWPLRSMLSQSVGLYVPCHVN